MRLRPETEQRFARYVEAVLEANELDPGADPYTTAARSFAVDPTIQQRLLDKIEQDDEGLLGRFNNLTVTEITGTKVFMGTNGKVVSSTTDTDTKDRNPVNPIVLTDDSYHCRETDFDTIIPFALLDNWAKFDNFEERIGNWLLRTFQNDRLKIGFNGLARAGNSDRDANPLGEDVNKGWLQNIREKAPEQVISEIVPASGEVTFGDGGDYKTIDQLVVEAHGDLIPKYHRQSPGIGVFISDNLLQERHYKVTDQTVPTEQIAADEIIKRARVGNLPALAAPWFPESSILITSEDNLSRYEQEGSRRRKIEHAPQKRGFVSWESFNEDFPVEDFERCALVENVTPFDPA